MFNVMFGLRRQWLECVRELLVHLTLSEVSEAQIRRDFQLTGNGIESVCAAAVGGLAELKRAQEAQYTAKHWVSLSAAERGGDHDSMPLRQSLGDMADVLGTIQAKVLVCRGYIDAGIDDHELAERWLHDASSEDRSPEQLARLFASLKSDIDMLNAHYQESVTRLLCADSGPNASCGSDGMGAGAAGSPEVALETGVGAAVDGARVFEYTLFSADGLDAPGLAFEADAASSQQGASNPLLVLSG
ncbi:hypothetical protein LPJ61_003336 [Coemansia biformis]|uniref:Uncharacterized protein n=1 Tax=Coemansia biformis TaxID=1286918 RepID=A0A9W7Y6R7_9FUNG|nr:hypothetical protein LPJ61_003336 [Coemansia biformis]